MAAWKNRLYYGDNLDVLQRYVKDESVDLVYLDPPFQSGKNYNVLFESHDETKAAAQIRAFEDTWHWNTQAEEAYEQVVTVGDATARTIEALRQILGTTDMMAYLCMMAPRLAELRRVLKPTGSLYLHCDPTASHYLKILLDAVFGAIRFRSEVIWKRTSSHSGARRFGPVHDVILYYSHSTQPIWNAPRGEYTEAYIRRFKKIDKATGKRFDDKDLTGPGVRAGPSGRMWREFDPTTKGRHWQLAAYVYKQYRTVTGNDLAAHELVNRLDKLDAAGLIFWPKKSTGWPRYKQFIEDAPGMTLQDVWTDIDPVNARAAERLGYPTQKPLALLERIINASSNPNDVVLDPFCGCGTAVHAAQKLGRRWIGIDITCLATNLIKNRLRDAFGDKANFDVVGEPVDLEGARQLAEADRFQFQCWALGFDGARATSEQKKGADRGIDGRLMFFDDPKREKASAVIFSVKSGATGPTHVRDLRGVIEREKAAIGAFITLRPATKAMQREAVSAGFYESAWGRFPRLQILTVEELLAGKRVQYPARGYSNVTLPKAQREKPETLEQRRIPLADTAPAKKRKARSRRRG